MNQERRVSVVTDSGCSIRPDSKEAQESGVTIVPLEVSFWENGHDVPYLDTSISPEEFYERMRTSKKLPKTSGVITGRLSETFQNLSHKTQSIMSIHITSEHSGVWQSAILAKDIVDEVARVEGKEPVPIEVIDTKQVSLTTWFPVKLADRLAQKGATLEQITSEVLEGLSKTHLYVTLQTFENLIKGGRANELAKAVLASILSIYPVLGLKDGKLTGLAKARTPKLARDTMVEMVGAAGKLVKVAVVHTNAIKTAESIKEALRKMYKDTIPIYDAGPVLAVHAGEGAIGIAFQTD